MTQLNTLELAVLRAMQDQHPRMSVEIANQIDQPGWSVREILKRLRAHHLITRSMLYDWRITDHGLNELSGHNQLRLVP
jgi:predicted transcriptional regulator